MQLKWKPVETKKEFDDWFSLTETIYGKRPTHFVPPDYKVLHSVWKNAHNNDQYVFLQFFCLYKNDQVVARTTLHEHANFSKKMSARTLLFGFTEWIDEPQIAEELFKHILEHATNFSYSKVFGPAGLLPNQSGGVLVNGFEYPAFVDGTYSPHYYASEYESQGFKKTFSAQTWSCSSDDWNTIDAETALKKSTTLNEKYKIKCIPSTKWKHYIPKLGEILNASFSKLGYYTFIPLGELKKQVENLSWIIDSKIALFVEEGNTPVAFLLCIPDISPILQKFHGRLGVRAYLNLLLQRKSFKSAVLIIQGVHPNEQGKGLLTMLTRELLKNLQSSNYSRLTTTWIEPSNRASSSQLKKIGCKPLHETTFYIKEV